MNNHWFLYLNIFLHQDDLVAVFFYDESKASAKVLFIITLFLFLSSVMNLVKWLEFELWINYGTFVWLEIGEHVTSNFR